MKDPYSVLGVSRSATDDEVKKAYRALAKKYHPDNYSGSAMAEAAEDRMKEINEAYDNIQKERSGQGSATGYGGTYTYNSSGVANFMEVRRMINAGEYSEAELIIDSIPANDRGAEWNYLKGCLLLQRGLYYDALKYIEIACYLDPVNPEYREMKKQMQTRSATFGHDYRTTGRASSCDACDICTTLLCADAICDCCGGDLISCC